MYKIRFSLLVLALIFTNVSFAQWSLKNNGIDVSANSLARAIDATDNNNAVAAFYKHIYKTTDAGENWLDITPPNASGFVDVSEINESNIWVVTEAGKILYYSGAGGWTEQFYDNSKTSFMNYIRMFDVNNGIAMGDPASGYSGATLFLKTTNGGKDWNQINTNMIGGTSGNSWGQVDFLNMNNGYFSAEFPQNNSTWGTYFTSDGGINWSPTGVEQVNVLKFYDKNIGLLAAFSKNIFRTSTGLATYETVPITNPISSDIEFFPGSSSQVLLLSYDDLYYSTDGGKTLVNILNKAPGGTANLNGRDLALQDSNCCWLISDTGRVFYINNLSTITDVEKTDNSHPTNFALEQNYPNPFNPSTIIKYKLEKSGFVTLKIYDFLGREVKTLISEIKARGNYSIEFNAQGLTSGVYFYELKSGKFVSVKKMILLR